MDYEIFMACISQILNNEKKHEDLWLIKWVVSEMYIHIRKNQNLGLYESMYDFVKKMDRYSLEPQPSSYIFAKAYDIAVNLMEEVDVILRRNNNES